MKRDWLRMTHAAQLLHSFSPFFSQDQLEEFLQYLISSNILALRRDEEKNTSLLYCIVRIWFLGYYARIDVLMGPRV